MKFIHVADVHLDSPLRGLEEYEGAPVERLRLATRRALENVVQLCLDEQVDFLLIAGDLFDTDCRDFNAALWAAKQMRILNNVGIQVYMILGNHDSREEMTRQAPWPDNVQLFDHKQPHSLDHPTLPVTFHGMSYPKREVLQNLVPDYPTAVPGRFNIGLLHCNAGGNANHDSYAPCTVAELVAKQYDYWALGHVHDYQLLHEHPHVVYSGNTQGRHAREVGHKGCVLVTIENGQVQPLEFRQTDVLRWFRAPIILEVDDDIDVLLDHTRSALTSIVAQSDKRLAAVRLEYSGQCQVHRKLSRQLDRDDVVAQIRGLGQDFGDDVWIEKVKFNTRLPLDVAALRQGQDLVGELLREIEGIGLDPARLLKMHEETLKALDAKVGRQLAKHAANTKNAEQIELDDPVRLGAWLRDAEDLLLRHLIEDVN